MLIQREHIAGKRVFRYEEATISSYNVHPKQKHVSRLRRGMGVREHIVINSSCQEEGLAEW